MPMCAMIEKLLRMTFEKNSDIRRAGATLPYSLRLIVLESERVRSWGSCRPGKRSAKADIVAGDSDEALRRGLECVNEGAAATLSQQEHEGTQVTRLELRAPCSSVKRMMYQGKSFGRVASRIHERVLPPPTTSQGLVFIAELPDFLPSVYFAYTRPCLLPEPRRLGKHVY